MLWLHRLRQVAVDAAVEPLMTAAVGGCEWSTGGGADGGGGFRRHDGGELACSRSVLWLHRLRQVAVEEALAEAAAAIVTAAVSGCEWSSGGGADGGGGVCRRDGKELACWQSVLAIGALAASAPCNGWRRRWCWTR